MINFIYLIETNFINVISFWSKLGIKEKNLSKYNSIIVDLPRNQISKITLNKTKADGKIKSGITSFAKL